MGRKLKHSSSLSDPESLDPTTTAHPEPKSDTKKKSKKNKHREPQVHVSPNKKQKKNKSNEEPKSNGAVAVSEESNSNSTDAVVMVTGKDAEEAKYKPLESFADSKLPSEVLQCCVNFQKPSPIQSRAWPYLLDGRDFIGIAKTGSGKTLAFGIPAINQVMNKRNGRFSRGRNPLCLVLAPTRELALCQTPK